MAAPMENNLFANLSTNYLNSRRKQAYLTAKFDEIEEIDYDTFFKQYLLPNKPCIFNQSVTKSWKSRHEWVTPAGVPDFPHLMTAFGDAIVPVANCKQEQYSSHPKLDMVMRDYLQYWEKYRNTGHPTNGPCLYMKDWHCTKAFPEYGPYTTPVYFSSDWLNEFWDTLPQDGYHFVYMGPKGSWTPFHCDVYRSYSWSANICGKKKWIFYPPGCEESLKDKCGNLIYDITSLDDDTNPEISRKFPKADEVKGQRLEVIQNEGQIIFVPSGWHHQVFNLEDTISINHNWLNGCNIDLCWEHLKVSLADVKQEISDCRDMEGWEIQCQVILNASAGIDYKTFIQMLKVIAENRLKYMKQIQNGALPHTKCDNSTNKKSAVENKIYQGKSVELTVNCSEICEHSNVSIDDKVIELEGEQRIMGVNSDNVIELAGEQQRIMGDTSDNVIELEDKQQRIMGVNSDDVIKLDGEQQRIMGDISDTVIETEEEQRIMGIIQDNDVEHVGEQRIVAVTSDAIIKLEGEQTIEIGEETTVINKDNSVERTTFQAQENEIKLTISNASMSINTVGDATINIISIETHQHDCSNTSCTSDIKDSNFNLEDDFRKCFNEDRVQYIMFDLKRIKEIVQEICEDKDYKMLELEYLESAEFVLNLVQEYV